MIARAIRHIVLLLLGELATLALARPWVYLLTYRQIDALLALEKYRESHDWNGRRRGGV